MINKVTLIGYAGQDPDTRTLENGTQVGRFSLATSDSFKDKEGNWQNQTEWHNVVVWRDLADRAKTQIKKGSLVFVEGKISSRKYTDKDGVEKNVIDIVANTFRLLEKREYGDQSAQSMPAHEYHAQSQPQVAIDNHTAPQSQGYDLPF
jgi:single-strand DNA-binding protein